MEALTLTSLICSRICHDLINPVGALSAGLEVLEDETDPGMKEEALNLIKVSTEKSVALLSFARIAFGAGGAYGQDIDIDEAKHVTVGLYEHNKAELEWQLEGGLVPKDFVKALLSIAILAGDCIPRGGVLSISGDMSGVVFDAKGTRAKIKDTFVDALSGKTENLEPKMAPGFLACLLAHQAGGRVTTEEVSEDHVRITASFPNYGQIAA